MGNRLYYIPLSFLLEIDISEAQEKGSMQAERVILHVDMDAFYASVEQRNHPEWRGKPVIVGAPPDRRGVVAAASYEARKFGVHSAMPSREAGRRCPDGIFVQPNMRLYEEESARIFAVFHRFTPTVESLSLDEAFLDVTGTIRIFGKGPEIARKIRAAIKAETGLTASVGVASNKFLAKIGSDLNKPDGLTIVPDRPDEIRAFLAPLSAGRLWGVGKVTQAALERVGIKSIGDIQRASLKSLAGVIGLTAAGDLKELADGVDDRHVETDIREKSISREHTFDDDTNNRARIERTFIGLVEDVGRQLRGVGRHAGGVQIKLRWQGFETITRRRKLQAPVNDDSALIAAGRELLTRELTTRAVRLVGFGVHSLCDGPAAQMMLFEDSAGAEKRRRVSRAMDAIRDKFGSSSISHAAGIER